MCFRTGHGRPEPGSGTLKSNVFGEVSPKRLDSEGLGGLGDILVIFGDHFGYLFGIFCGFGGIVLALLGGPGRILKQILPKRGKGISVSSVLGPKSGPKASSRRLERHQN